MPSNAGVECNWETSNAPNGYQCTLDDPRMCSCTRADLYKLSLVGRWRWRKLESQCHIIVGLLASARGTRPFSSLSTHARISRIVYAQGLLPKAVSGGCLCSPQPGPCQRTTQLEYILRPPQPLSDRQTPFDLTHPQPNARTPHFPSPTSPAYTWKTWKQEDRKGNPYRQDRTSAC